MNWLVVSDVHSAEGKFKRLLKKETSADGFIFAGDGVRIVSRYKENFKRFYAVSGNCDFSFDAEQEILINSDGLKIFLCHGHKYRVKYDMISLFFRARELEANICVFGHTHRPALQWKHGILFLNPGSLLNNSYAVLTIEGQANAQIKQLD